MGALSDYLENKIIDYVLRGQTFTAPTNVYVALLTSTKGPRQNTTAYSLNDTISLTATDTRTHLYKCTTAGTSAGSQPGTYTGTVAEAITDGSAVFTEQSAVLDAMTGTTMTAGGGGISTEPASANGYARQTVASSLANWAGTQGAGTTSASSGTGATTSNNNAITFPSPTPGNWGYIWAYAVCDALTLGNLLWWGGLTTVKTVNGGDAAPSFAAGQAQLQLDT